MSKRQIRIFSIIVLVLLVFSAVVSILLYA
jgi:hypothetical protein